MVCVVDIYAGQLNQMLNSGNFFREERQQVQMRALKEALNLLLVLDAFKSLE